MIINLHVLSIYYIVIFSSCSIQTNTQHWVGYQRTTCQLKNHSYTILYDGFITNQTVRITIWVWCTWSCGWFETKASHHGCDDGEISVPRAITLQLTLRWLTILKRNKYQYHPVVLLYFICVAITELYSSLKQLWLYSNLIH